MSLVGADVNNVIMSSSLVVYGFLVDVGAGG
jgi:hypothetical protein